MWATKDGYGSSMRWHEVDPASVEEYEYEYGWGNWKETKKAFRAAFVCPSVDYGKPVGELKIKDKINIYQSNVCAYCRNRILKRDGIESRLLK